MLKRLNRAPHTGRFADARARAEVGDYKDPFEGLPSVSTVDPMLSMTRPKFAHQQRDIWSSGSKLVLSSFQPPAPTGDSGAASKDGGAGSGHDRLSSPVGAPGGGGTASARSLATTQPGRNQRRRPSDAASCAGSLDSFRMDVLNDVTEEDRRATLRRRNEDVLVKRYLDAKAARDGLAQRDRVERAELFANTRDAVKWRAVFQLHCHLTAVSDPAFDPTQALLDEPKRKAREARERRKAREQKSRRKRGLQRAKARQMRAMQGASAYSGASVLSPQSSMASSIRADTAQSTDGDDDDSGDNSSDLEAELADDEHALAVLRAARAPAGAMESDSAARAAILPGPGSGKGAPGAYLKPLFAALYKQNPGSRMSKSRFLTTTRGLMLQWVIDSINRRRKQDQAEAKRGDHALARVRAMAAERRKAARTDAAAQRALAVSGRFAQGAHGVAGVGSAITGVGIADWDPEDGGMPSQSTSLIASLRPAWGASAGELAGMTESQREARALLCDRLRPPPSSGMASPLRAGFGTISGTMSGPGHGGIARFGGEFAAVAAIKDPQQRRTERRSRLASSTALRRAGGSAVELPPRAPALGSAAASAKSSGVGSVSAAVGPDPSKASGVEAEVLRGVAHLPKAERATMRLAVHAYAQERLKPAVKWLETVAAVFAMAGVGEEGDEGADKGASEGAAGILNWREVLVALHVIVDPFALPHQHMRWAFAMYGSSSTLDDRPQPPVRMLSPARKPPSMRTGWATRAQAEATIVALPQLKPEDTPHRKAWLSYIKSVPNPDNAELPRPASGPAATLRPGTVHSGATGRASALGVRSHLLGPSPQTAPSSRPASPPNASSPASPVAAAGVGASVSRSPSRVLRSEHVTRGSAASRGHYASAKQAHADGMYVPELHPMRQHEAAESEARRLHRAGPSQQPNATAMVARSPKQPAGQALGGRARGTGQGDRGQPLWRDGPGEEHWPGMVSREVGLLEVGPEERSLAEKQAERLMDDEAKAEKAKAERLAAASLGLTEADLQIVRSNGHPRWPDVGLPGYPGITCQARTIIDVLGALVASADKRVEIEDMVMELQSVAYLPQPDPESLEYIVEEAEAYDKLVAEQDAARSAASRRAELIARRAAATRTRDPWQWHPELYAFLPRKPRPPRWHNRSNERGRREEAEARERDAETAAEEAATFALRLGVGATEPEHKRAARISTVEALRRAAAGAERGAAAAAPEAAGAGEPFGGGSTALVASGGAAGRGAGAASTRLLAEQRRRLGSDGFDVLASLTGDSAGSPLERKTKLDMLQVYRLLDASLNRGSANWGMEAEREIAAMVKDAEANSTTRKLPPVVLALPSLRIAEPSEREAKEMVAQGGRAALLQHKRSQLLRRAKYGRLLFHMLREVLSDDPDESSGVSLVKKKASGAGMAPRGAVRLRDFDQLLLTPPLFQLMRPRVAFETRTDAPACEFEELYDPVIRAYIVQCRDTFRKAMSVRRVVRRWSSLRLHNVLEQWILFVARRRHTRYKLARFTSALQFAQRRAIVRRWRRLAATNSAAERLQGIFRQKKAVEMVRSLRPRVNAAKTIQSTWRMHKYGLCVRRGVENNMRIAATHMQRLLRGVLGRKRVRRLVQARFRREMAVVRREHQRLKLVTEVVMAARIQRAIRAFFVRRELRKMREKLWEARHAERAMAEFERQQELERRTQEAELAALLAKQLEAAKQKEAEEAQAEESRRWMRIQRMQRDKRTSLYQRRQELLDLDAECTRRINEAKARFAEQRISAQNARRDQLVKLIRDLGFERPHLREAISYLDSTMDSMPEVTMGGTGWRNFSDAAEAAEAVQAANAAARGAATGTGPVVAAKAFTTEELQEQKRIDSVIEKDAAAQLERIREAVRSGVGNKQAASQTVDAYVAAITNLVSEELAKIAVDNSQGENDAIAEVASYRRAETKRAEQRYLRRMGPARKDAVLMIQQAVRARKARDMLAATVRAAFVKRWDEERVCFVYENTFTGALHTRRPVVFGPYDLRCEGKTAEEEQTLWARARERHGVDAFPVGSEAMGLGVFAGASDIAAGGTQVGRVVIAAEQGAQVQGQGGLDEEGTDGALEDWHETGAEDGAGAYEHAAEWLDPDYAAQLVPFTGPGAGDTEQHGAAAGSAAAASATEVVSAGSGDGWAPGSGGEVWWQEDGQGGGYYTDGAGFWDDIGAYYLFDGV